MAGVNYVKEIFEFHKSLEHFEYAGKDIVVEDQIEVALKRMAFASKNH